MRKALAIGVVLATTSALFGRAEAQSLGPQPDTAWTPSWPAESFVFKTSPSGASGEQWRGLIWPPMSGGMVDRLAISAGEGVRGGPEGQPLLLGRFGGESEGPIGQLTSGFRQDWPSAFRMKTGAFGFDVTPHAALDVSGVGSARAAGALVRFGRGYGDGEPRHRSGWFLFASEDQEALGMNFLHNEDAWKRMGLGSDPGAVIDDTRAGVAWRNGPLEASVGYLYREIRPHDWDMLDAQTNREHLVSFRLTFHPGQR